MKEGRASARTLSTRAALASRLTGRNCMRGGLPDQPDYSAAIQSWRRRAPWYRRLSARLGLQGKLIVCFMMLLLTALGGSYWLFLREARTNLWRSISERNVSLAQTLAMAATAPLYESDLRELTRI